MRSKSPYCCDRHLCSSVFICGSFPLRAAVAIFLAAIVYLPASRGGDWPQLLGPTRNGVAVDERLATSWPAGGPKTLWQRPVGSGFAGVSVVGATAVLFHRLGEQELVEALDAQTGQPLWKAAFTASFVPSYTTDDGPRAPPVIAQGRVFCYGAMGQLRALELSSGKVLWQRDLFDEYNSKRPFHGEPPEGYFGVGTSPLVEGDRVLVNVGGDTKQAGIVALAADTGRTLWTATSQRASYSSPIAVTIDGVRLALFVTRLSVVALDPQSGAVRFEFPLGRTGPTVNAANPVVCGGHLLVTANYGIGSVLARLHGDRAEEVWRDPRILASQYTTSVEKDGCLFGVHGRQDGPPAELRCFEPLTRAIRWSQPEFGYATLILADDKLLVQKTDGTLILAAADTRQYRELARGQAGDGEVRALPALAGGRLYVRDTRQLRCLDVGR